VPGVDIGKTSIAGLQFSDERGAITAAADVLCTDILIEAFDQFE